MKTPDDAAEASGLSSCSCSTATAQARLRCRDLSVPWGAKRRRTGRSSAAVGSRWRDWAGLDEGPAGLIAERVLASDVADYVRFRAACLPWRRCCDDPRARGVLEDPRLYPRHWIMLRDADDDDDYYAKLGSRSRSRSSRRRFLNTRTGECVHVDVPELLDHGIFQRSTADGLLLMHCKQTEAVRLLNPLTRQMAELPRTTGLAESSPLYAAGLLDHSTVFLYDHGRGPTGTMAIARPGDDRWALIDAGRELIMPMVFFAGRFYGVTASGIVTVDMDDGAGGGGPRLVVAAPLPFRFRVMTDTVHLVDNGDGDLRLVHRTLLSILGCYGDEFAWKTRYRVYRVDFGRGKTTMLGRRCLGGRAIFIDYYGALSVSPRVFPFLSEDTIYLGLSFSNDKGAGGERIGAYHVRDGTIEPRGNGDSQAWHRLAYSYSIADTLIAYVSDYHYTIVGHY